MQNDSNRSPIMESPPNQKASFRLRETRNLNLNRREMSVSVSESFLELHEMNKKALRILAKRG